ncbi:MAG TPA: hypothetical protein VHT74_32410 [Acetobacteraceae bacterium]|jgi:hypothetical protein|nr:hypothetical protein [Acetobacteraceae bacterium]
MEITVTPTDEMFSMDGTIVRAWEGRCDEGTEVVALICGVRAAREFDDLTPIPPPQEDWSDGVRAAMGELWQIAYAMTDADAEMLLMVAHKLVAERMAEYARGFAAGIAGGDDSRGRARDQETPIHLPAAGAGGKT